MHFWGLPRARREPGAHKGLSSAPGGKGGGGGGVQRMNLPRSGSWLLMFFVVLLFQTHLSTSSPHLDLDLDLSKAA